MFYRFLLLLACTLFVVPVADAGKIQRAFGESCYQDPEESWDLVKSGPYDAGVYEIPGSRRFLGKVDKVLALTDDYGRLSQVGFLITDADHEARIREWLTEEFGEPRDVDWVSLTIDGHWTARHQRWDMGARETVTITPMLDGSGVGVAIRCSPLPQRGIW